MTQVIKVSKAGYDVLTESDINNYIFDSRYNTFKIIAEGTLLNQTVNTDPKTFTVAHGLSYTPTVFAFALFPDGYLSLPFETDQVFTVYGSRHWTTTVDATNINFIFYKGGVSTINTIYNKLTSGVDDSAVGNTAWSDPGDVVESDNNYASADLDSGDQSHWLKMTNFGFSIPTSATIVGITMQVEGYYSGEFTWTLDYIRIIKGGSIGGTNRTAILPSGSDGTDTAGGTSDMWGESWTPSDINASNFGVAISTIFSGDGSRIIYIDQVLLKVTYTLEGGNYSASAKYYIFETPIT